MYKEVELLRDTTGAILEYRRSIAVLMWSKGVKVKKIAETLGVSQASVYEWLNNFRKYGAEGLKDNKKSGRPPKVSEGFIDLLDRLVACSPREYGYKCEKWTLGMLRNELARQTGIRISIEHTRRLKDRHRELP